MQPDGSVRMIYVIQSDGEIFFSYIRAMHHISRRHVICSIRSEILSIYSLELDNAHTQAIYVFKCLTDFRRYLYVVKG